MMYDGILLKPELDDLYLKHFNPNHDPNNGQFASGNGIGYSSKKLKYFVNEEDQDIDDVDIYINNSADRINKYQDEFDETEKGKQLLKKFRNAPEKNYNSLEDAYLKERQKYAVNKFLKNDSKKFTLDDVIKDNYIRTGEKNLTESEVIDYLLNEEWKVYRE